MKLIALIIVILLGTGCASIGLVSTECKQAKDFLIKDDGCPYGWAAPGITGHPPACLTEQEYLEIKEHCPDF